MDVEYFMVHDRLLIMKGLRSMRGWREIYVRKGVWRAGHKWEAQGAVSKHA